MQEPVHVLSQQLQEATKRIDLIRTVASELTKILPLAEKLHAILKILHGQFGIQYSMILLPDTAGEKLVVKSSYGYENKNLGAELHMGIGIAGLAALNRRPIN